MQTWRDYIVVETADSYIVALPHHDNPRFAETARHDDTNADLAAGYFTTWRKLHAMTHPEFTGYFNQHWPRRDSRRDGPGADKWEAFYEALLTEYQARATSLNGLTPPGMTREEFRTLWEMSGKGDAAYAAAVQGAFNATEVTK